MSYSALEVALALRQHGKLVIGHVADPDKNYLPKHLTPEYLKFDLECKCTAKAVPTRAFSISVQPKVVGHNTRSMVLNMASNCDAEFLVLGSFGRKGPSIFQIKSVTDWSVRSSPLTTIIVKPTSSQPTKGEPSVFVVALDGSQVAEKALHDTLQLMAPHDHLFALHISMDYVDGNQRQAAGIKEKYDEVLKKALIAGGVEIQEKISGKTLAQQICAFAVDKGAHYLACGIDGMTAFAQGKTALGSVTDSIVKTARCTTIISKYKELY